MRSTNSAYVKTGCHLIMIAFLSIFVFTGAAFPATRVVSTRSSAAFVSAVTASQAGDTITFNLPADSEAIDLSSTISIAKRLTIDGSNSGGSGTPVTFQMSQSGATLNRVFTITAGIVSLRNLTITGGQNSAQGGGVLIGSDTLTKVYMTHVTITRCRVVDSVENRTSAITTYAYGGAIYNSGLLVMDSCMIINNNVYSYAYCNVWPGGQAYAYGGGIYNTGKCRVSACTISNDTAKSFAQYNDAPRGYSYGGGVYNAGIMTIVNSTVAGNYARASAASADSPSASCYGGGINNDGRLAMAFCTVFGNATSASGSWFADSYGGGLNNNGIAEISSCTFSGNTSSSSSGDNSSYGINANGTTSILNCIITGQNRQIDYDGKGTTDTLRVFNSIVGTIPTTLTSGSTNKWDSSNLDGKTVATVFGTNTLADNGGFTRTVALPDTSIAAGSGVRVGTYTAHDTVHYDAHWNGTTWRAVSTNLPVSGVTSLDVDQRGVSIEDPPCVGSYYIKKTIGVRFSEYSSKASGTIITCIPAINGRSLILSNRSGSILDVALIAPNGRLFRSYRIGTTFAADISTIASGNYFVFIKGPGNISRVFKMFKN